MTVEEKTKSNTPDYDDGIKLRKAGDKKGAFEAFERGADKGEPNAMFELGNCYVDGDIVKKDYCVAIEWYRRAADAGLAEAQCKLGAAYYLGYGAEPDYALAAEWMTKSAEQNFAEAQSCLGWLYLVGHGVPKDCAKAAELYRKAAEQGHSDAQTALADMYADGRGVEQDHSKAFEWYLKAAKGGDVEGQNDVGYCYHNGLGCERDYEKAFEWYLKAANNGAALAQSNVGACYAKGHGVERDVAESVKWYLKAAENGVELAMRNLGASYKDGSGVDKSYEHAYDWYRLAVLFGDRKAADDVKSLVESGKVTRERAAEPLELPSWFENAVEQTDKETRDKLLCKLAKDISSGMISIGDGNDNYVYDASAASYLRVVKDENRIFELYARAAKNGSMAAYTALGSRYYYGRGVDIDYDKAFDRFRIAAKNGNTDAMIWLAECYDTGRGTPVDHEKEAEILRKLCDISGDEYARADHRKRLLLLYADGKVAMPDDERRESEKKLAELAAGAENGSANARYLLAHHYETGDLGIRDYALALKWYKAAAKQGDAMSKTAIKTLKDKMRAAKRS